MRTEPNTQKARSAATQLIERYGITLPAEIAVEEIAFARGAITRKGPMDGAEAWLIREGQRGVIRVSQDIKEYGRHRFAVAHELGHWECHVDQSQPFSCTSDDIHRSYQRSVVEIEANAFAAELLMPRSMLRPRLQQSKKGICMELVGSVAAEFETTLMATARRVVEESGPDAFVVFSQDNCVQWWQRGGTGPGFSIPVHHTVPLESSACWCNRMPSDPGEMRSLVSASAWFPSLPDGDGIEVWEESAMLGGYGLVMTLLYVV